MRLSTSLASLAYAVFVTLTPAPASAAIDTTLYNTLQFYYQYAASSYYDTCAKPNGNTLVTYLNDSTTDTQGFIARDDTKKEIVVVFRGTLSEVDFDTDFDVELVPYTSSGVNPPTNTTVHEGFLGAYNSVASAIISTVKSQLASYPSYSLVTSGHSLGGGLSSLAAVSLKANFPSSPVRLYSYGQPRTGNTVYAGYVDSLFPNNAFRVVHQNDSVPTFVPRSFGYQHHGTEYWLNPDPASATNAKQCTGDEDPTCSDSIPSTTFLNQDHLVYFGIWFVTSFC